ncbi:hypothetical protein [Sphingomonas profundi]|nr:hypothetical protein [Sphingomonas profundi]
MFDKLEARWHLDIATGSAGIDIIGSRRRLGSGCTRHDTKERDRAQRQG